MKENAKYFRCALALLCALCMLVPFAACRRGTPDDTQTSEPVPTAPSAPTDPPETLPPEPPVSPFANLPPVSLTTSLKSERDVRWIGVNAGGTIVAGERVTNNIYFYNSDAFKGIASLYSTTVGWNGYEYGNVLSGIAETTPVIRYDPQMTIINRTDLQISRMGYFPYYAKVNRLEPSWDGALNSLDLGSDVCPAGYYWFVIEALQPVWKADWRGGDEIAEPAITILVDEVTSHPEVDEVPGITEKDPRSFIPGDTIIVPETVPRAPELDRNLEVGEPVNGSEFFYFLVVYERDGFEATVVPPEPFDPVGVGAYSSGVSSLSEIPGIGLVSGGVAVAGWEVPDQIRTCLSVKDEMPVFFRGYPSEHLSDAVGEIPRLRGGLLEGFLYAPVVKYAPDFALFSMNEDNADCVLFYPFGSKAETSTRRLTTLEGAPAGTYWLIVTSRRRTPANDPLLPAEVGKTYFGEMHYCFLVVKEN